MKAMILAAGRGERLKPLTDHLPKPLIEIQGAPVIVHTLRRLAELDVRDVVINAWHLADTLMAALGDGAAWGVSIQWSRETCLMNTGGGLRQALPLLGDAPFLSINADILWDADLRPLLRAFDPARMTALLALTPNPSHARGDFRLLPDGCLERAPGASDSLTYTGIQIMQPDALRPYPVAPFSVNSLYDRAISDGTLVGQPLEGRWMDIGTHERLTQAHSRWRIRNQTPVPEWAPCPAR